MSSETPTSHRKTSYVVVVHKDAQGRMGAGEKADAFDRIPYRGATGASSTLKCPLCVVPALCSVGERKL